MSKKVSFRIFRLDIPFREAFAHASATRDRTASIWVEAVMDGETGYGEGCPRPYVSGETVESASAFLDAIASEAAHLIAITPLKQWIKANRERIDANPAAWCAMELALLDLIGKLERKSIESLLGIGALKKRFQFSAVVGQGSMQSFVRTVEAYRQIGMADMKIKLSGDVENDGQRLQHVRHQQLNHRLRLDANNCWQSASGAIEALAALGEGFFAVEEPVNAYDYHAMEAIADELGVQIILDESFLRLRDFEALLQAPNHWIINLRVSKMGGLIRSLEIIETAKNTGIGVIVGAQVGETSLLTRAGLTAATAAGDLLLAQEGAFGTRLLREDICPHPLMFGPGGVLETARDINLGYGFAVNIRAPDSRRSLLSVISDCK